VTQQQVDSAGQEYEIVGRVVAVAENKQSVTLDHEDIPGFMPGMEMKFDIEDPTVVADIEPGDSVQGRLTVKDGSYVISELKRR
jgi:Cu/Ag efflux protein CusF